MTDYSINPEEYEMVKEYFRNDTLKINYRRPGNFIKIDNQLYYIKDNMNLLETYLHRAISLIGKKIGIETLDYVPIKTNNGQYICVSKDFVGNKNDLSKKLDDKYNEKYYPTIYEDFKATYYALKEIEDEYNSYGIASTYLKQILFSVFNYDCDKRGLDSNVKVLESNSVLTLNPLFDFNLLSFHNTIAWDNASSDIYFDKDDAKKAIEEYALEGESLTYEDIENDRVMYLKKLIKDYVEKPVFSEYSDVETINFCINNIEDKTLLDKILNLDIEEVLNEDFVEFNDQITNTLTILFTAKKEQIKRQLLETRTSSETKLIVA